MASNPDTTVPSDQSEQDEGAARTELRSINTQGGDYAERGIDKRQGVFIKDSTILSGVVNQMIIQSPLLSAFLHQLPDPVGDFVGRKTEMNHLLGALQRRSRTRSSAVIGIIYGMGGVGKTELARKIAQHLVLDYSDAQLFVELRGSSDHPLTPEQALQTIILSFEREAKLPENLNQLQNIYRDKLSGKRALIMLDDAKDAAQVRPLLPPSGSALLITTRNRFTLPQTTLLDLETLPPHEAKKMLLSICPRIERYAPMLAELCGYLPLALRVCASFLQINDTREVVEYVEQLKTERLQYLKDPDSPKDPQVSVEASLRLSYETLQLSEQRALCQLSLFPVSFDSSAVNAILVTDGNIQESIELLRRRSLLRYDVQTKRYNLHDLVRVFANSIINNTERNLTRQRYNAYYLALAEQAEFELIGSKQEDWLERLDRERSHLEMAMQQMLEDKDQQSLLRLTGALWRFWDIRGYLRTGRRWFDLALSQTAEANTALLDNRAVRAKALKGAGLLAKQQGDYLQARIFQEESIELYTLLGDRKGIASALYNIGSITFHQGLYNESLDFSAQSLAIFRDLEDQRGIAMTLGNLGLIAQDQDNYPQSIGYYEESIDILRKLGDQSSLAIYLGNLGNLFWYQKNYESALIYYRESLQIREMLKDRRGIASSLDNIGWVALDKGAIEEAIEHFIKSLTIFHELGDHEGVIWGLEGLAYVSMVKEPDRAVHLFSAADSLRKQLCILRPAVEQSSYQGAIDKLHNNLGNMMFDTAWQIGQSLTADQAITKALMLKT